MTEAAKSAIALRGAGAGASRLAGGNDGDLEALETDLAAHYGYDACLLAGSGYLTNVGALASLAQKGDLIVADKFSHACMIDGARLSGADLLRFRHNDAAHCLELLKKKRAAYRKCVVMTESVFSMDGDAAPILALSDAAKAYDALLYVDHAHGVGFVSPKGADVVVGTLSKALGSYGGYVLCDARVKDFFLNHMRSVIFSTALPPACVAAARAALRVIADDPERVRRAGRAAERFAARLSLPSPAGAVVPVTFGAETRAVDAAEHMRRQGVVVSAVRPPAVPPNASRLRFAFNADHAPNDVDRALEAVMGLVEGNVIN